MRKDLKLAFELAAEQNPLEHYKEILQSFQEELIAQEEAKKEAAATPKKSKKGKAKASDDEDVDMDDVDEAPKPKTKKRKAAEEDAAVSCSPFRDRGSVSVSLTKKPCAGPSAFRLCQEAQDQAQHIIHVQGGERHSGAQGQGRQGRKDRKGQAQEGFGQEGRAQGSQADARGATRSQGGASTLFYSSDRKN